MRAGQPGDVLNRSSRILERRGGSLVTVPSDAALPTMRLVLDTDVIRDALQRSLGDGATTTSVRVRFLRYKPQTYMDVEYEAVVDGRPRLATAMIAARTSLEPLATEPESVRLANLVAGRSPVPFPLTWDRELAALIQWYPLDLALPAMAQPPASLADALAGLGVIVDALDLAPGPLAYKPRRRAVLRFGSHVVKIYARDNDFSKAAAGLRTSGRLGGILAPHPEGANPGLRLTVQSFLDGASVATPASVADEAGALLAALHRSPGDEQPIARSADQLRRASRSAALVMAILPALTDRVGTLLARLAATLPHVDEVVLSHGDFNPRQLLVRQDGLALVDFDSLHLAPRALDPATFAAHLVGGGAADVDAALETLDLLASSYDREASPARDTLVPQPRPGIRRPHLRAQEPTPPLGPERRPDMLTWYLATEILRRATRPFRSFEPDWPARVEAVVRSAEQVLRG